VSPSLPGLRFRLFGFPITIGVDFLLVTLIIGLQARPGVLILEWVLVVAFSILIHELGHAFALGLYNIHPEIRLWGLGGLTISGFVLPPRKAILVSLAGPLVGIPVAVAFMAVQPWLPTGDPFGVAVSDLIFVNLWWGILNLVPIAGLDGGNVVKNLFVEVMGQRGKRLGLAAVAVCSGLSALIAILTGFYYLAIVIVVFGLLNPEPYLTLWQVATRGTGSAHVAGTAPTVRGKWADPPAPIRDEPRPTDRRGRVRSVAAVAAESRRAFAETYAETLPTSRVGADIARAGVATGAGAVVEDLDIDELERRPAPLLPDVVAMIARRDDTALAARLASETDPLAVLGIVTRAVEGKRVPQLLGTLRRDATPDRTAALLKLQVGLHALGRFEDALAAASILGAAGGAPGAVLEARSAARDGDRKRTAAALRRAVSLGPVRLSDAALGDMARIGPDREVADALARLRAADLRR
jgi:Zn-dependent protease